MSKGKVINVGTIGHVDRSTKTVAMALARVMADVSVQGHERSAVHAIEAREVTEDPPVIVDPAPRRGRNRGKGKKRKSWEHR